MSGSKTQPALIGGLVMGVLSALPIVAAGNLCCCLWIISGGVVAAYLLQQNQSAPVTPGDGALVGLLAGMAGDRLTAGLQRIIDKYALPYVAYNQGSIVHLETSGVMLLDLKHPVRFARQMKPRKHMMEEMGAAYRSQGLIMLAGSRMYTSMADTDEVIDDALNRFETVLAACV